MSHTNFSKKDAIIIMVIVIAIAALLFAELIFGF